MQPWPPDLGEARAWRHREIVRAEMTRLGRTLASLMLMLLGPPLVLLLWAHLVRPIWHGSELIALFAAGLLGLGGVVSATWSNRVQAVVAMVHPDRLGCA